MNKEFVTYEQALELKELGYNQEFDNDGIWYYATLSSGKIREFCWTSGEDEPYKMYKPIVAPLYQQAFRWFREKYKLNCIIAFCEYAIKSENSWKFTFGNPTSNTYWEGKFKTYEEAEQACLDKLIEIIKNGK